MPLPPFREAISSFISRNPEVSAAIVLAIGGIIGVIIGAMVQPCPTCIECPSNCTTSVEHMEDRNMWIKDPGPNSTIATESISALNNNGIQINYNLSEGGYVAIYKEIKPEKLMEKEGLCFHYNGSGAPNTIELVLVQKNNKNEDVRFICPSNNATQTNNQWRTIPACYEDFLCWSEPQRCEGENLNLNTIHKIGIAISNQEGDTAGKGSVIVDEIESTIC